MNDHSLPNSVGRQTPLKPKEEHTRIVDGLVD